MIYTRFGGPVKLLDVQVREVELERGKAEIWFCRAELAGPYPDGSGKAGELVAGGDWFQAGAELKADDGWAEIHDALQMLGAKKFLTAVNG